MNTFFLGTSDLAGTVAVGQTGTIPSDTKTLLFKAAPDLVYGAEGPTLSLSFAGETLTFLRLGAEGNFELFGADISAHAGNTGELLFRAVGAAKGVGGRAIIDDIQFSSLPIPEPSAFMLLPFGLGLMVFGGMVRLRARERKL